MAYRCLRKNYAALFAKEQKHTGGAPRADGTGRARVGSSQLAGDRPCAAFSS